MIERANLAYLRGTQAADRSVILRRFRRTFVERVTRVTFVIFVMFTIFYYFCCIINKIIRTFVAANYYDYGNNDNHNDTTGDYHGGRIAARR